MRGKASRRFTAILDHHLRDVTTEPFLISFGRSPQPRSQDEMPHAGKMMRRDFIGRAAVGSVAFPTIVPATVFGTQDKAPPSERITVGFIGCGKMANDYHLPTLLGFGDVQAVAVCDVDRTRRDGLGAASRNPMKGRPSTKDAPPIRTTASSSLVKTSTPCASPRRSTGTRSRPSRR